MPEFSWIVYRNRASADPLDLKERVGDVKDEPATYLNARLDSKANYTVETRPELQLHRPGERLQDDTGIITLTKKVYYLVRTMYVHFHEQKQCAYVNIVCKST